MWTAYSQGLPPGWYPHPDGSGGFRWWDGVNWTSHQSAPSTRNEDPFLPWILPTGRTGLAIAAGYLGLFSVLVVFAPISLVVGILALRQLNRTPGKLGRGRAIFGIVMGSLCSIILISLIVWKL